MVTVKLDSDSREGLQIGTFLAVRMGNIKKYYKITNRDSIFLRDAHASLATGTTEAFD